jgi:TolB-like protein/DNA-binding winged helix-turn-helix (wHTH) protein
MDAHDKYVLFEFGDFTLSRREHALLRKGEPVLLTPKAFETLAALVERSGRVVTKDELMEIVWPETFVEEAGLARNISVLRKSLGKTENGKNFIETVPKIGYRFGAKVFKRHVHLIQPLSQGLAAAQTEQTHHDTVSTPDNRVEKFTTQPARYWVAAAMLAAFTAIGLSVLAYRHGFTSNTPSKVAGESTSIAVLPFKPISADAADKNLEIGITDALITRLSTLKRLAVKPTSAVRRYADDEADSRSAGRELAVETVLEGNIQRIEDRIRVTVQLVNVADGSSLWAEKFEERIEDIFSVEDAIAEKVIAALKLRLDAQEQERLYRQYTANVDAFQSYMRGRNLLTQYTKESTLGSIEAFEEALLFDPNYALARAGLATASAEMFLRFASEQDSEHWAERADQEIKLALAADPEVAETHQALAAVYRKKDFNWERVLNESSRALELNPNLEQAHYYKAAAFYHLGLLDEAIEEASLAEKINPQDRTDSLRTRGVIALYEGRYADAIASFEAVQRLSSKPISDSHLVQAYFYSGDAKKAEWVSGELSRDPSHSASSRATASLASFLAATGRRGEAEKILSGLEGKESLDHHAAYSIGAAYAQLGNTAKAIDWLRRAAASGLPCYPLYQNDKMLGPIRSSAQFQEFLRDLQTARETARQRLFNR